MAEVIKKSAVKDTAKVKTKPKPVTKEKVDVSKLPKPQEVFDELAKRDDRYWLRYYVKIVNKDGDTVPFVLNSIQERIDDKIKELEAAGIPARFIILKARQVGGSTYIQGKFVCRVIKNKNRNALIVAHRDDSTNAIFEKSKFMNNHLPNHIKPLQQASNARELIFDKPPYYKGKEVGLNSRIKVQTAGSDGIGRSDTYFYVHLSEFAFYTGNPKKSLTGILKSVPKKVGTIVAIESTANGMNDFKDLWDKAEAGKSQWVPLFFAWFDSPEYQMPVTEEESKAITQSIKGSKTHRKDCDCLPCYLCKISELYSLTVEQIAWYQWSLENDCSGDRDLMSQECPSYPAEAFLATGRPVFANEQIEIRIEQLKKLYKEHPPKVGRFTFEWIDADYQDQIKEGSIQWVDDPKGFITIYEDVQKDFPYVIGGDTKGEGGDFYAASLINNITGNRVASMHMQSSNSQPYTQQIYCLGMYFNTALIGIEMNFNTSPLETLERWRYPKQYMRETYDKISHDVQRKFGWKTDGNTRNLIIDKEINLIENNINLFTDITMLGECLTFIYDKNNRADAQPGKHDDLLMSDMIAAEIRPQQRMSVHKEVTYDYSKLPSDVLEDLDHASAEERAYILKKIGR